MLQKYMIKFLLVAIHLTDCMKAGMDLLTTQGFIAGNYQLQRLLRLQPMVDNEFEKFENY